MSVLDERGAGGQGPVPEKAPGAAADPAAAGLTKAGDTRAGDGKAGDGKGGDTRAGDAQAGDAKAAPEQPRPGRRGLPLALNAVSVVLGVAVWWMLSVAGFKLPAPPEVVSQAGTLIGNGMLADDVLASLTRVLAGFALGTAAAVPIGFLMGWYPVLRGLIEPWIQFFRTIPPLAIIPLAIVVMGIDETPKIFVIFLAAFLACVISTFQGVVNVDRTLINAAQVLGAEDATIFARVVVPASTPFILVGMRVGLGSAWATLVAAELVAARQGLGYRMQNAQLYYDLPTIFVGLISIGILGLLMDRILLLAERKLTGWQERR